MEASIFNLNATLSLSSHPNHEKNKWFQRISLPLRKDQKRLCCLKLEGEINVEGDEWMMEMGKRCKEKRGMVEIMECLEKEAIMGEDQGKLPADYCRRAQIFDKSSRVFRALKECSEANHF